MTIPLTMVSHYSIIQIYNVFTHILFAVSFICTLSLLFDALARESMSKLLTPQPTIVPNLNLELEKTAESKRRGHVLTFALQTIRLTLE